MASIKEAFTEVFQDDNSFVKSLILAIPLYFCVNAYINGSKEEMAGLWWLCIVTYLLLFGFFIKCTANVRNTESHVMPSLNLFELIWNGFKGTLALGPSIAINSYIAYFLCDLAAKHLPASVVLTAFQTVIKCIFASIVLTGYMCFSRKFKISDAYNLKAISKSSADIMIAALFMIPQLLLAASLLLLPICYLLWLFWGTWHPISIFYYCIVFVYTLAMAAHYLAQIDFETIDREDEEMY